MPKCDFNKVAKEEQLRCSPENLLYIFKTPFTKNTSGQLFLNTSVQIEFQVTKYFQSIMIFLDYQKEKGKGKIRI